MTDETKPEPQSPEKDPSGDEPESDASEDLAYEFKIVPADPKSSFDFEDVADK